jgi:hypothetical protein
MTMSNYTETVKLPFELTNSNNGRGHHWGGSAKIRKQFEETLRKLRMVRTPFLFPVKVHVVRVLGKGQREWDYDSIGRGNAKEIFDALVACGWFSDDSPRFITGVSYDQDISQRSKGPFVEVTITQDGVFEGEEQKEELEYD